VADGVAGDVARRIEHQGELRLGNVPGRAVANTKPRAATDTAPRRRFQEDLRPGGIVDTLMHVGLARLFHARIPAAAIGDAGGPDFLLVNWSPERYVPQRVGTDGGTARCDDATEPFTGLDR